MTRCPHYAGGIRSLCFWCHRDDRVRKARDLAAQCAWSVVCSAMRQEAGLGEVEA